MRLDDAGEQMKDQAFSDLVKRADALILVVPEYNHGYPGLLKHALDLNRSFAYGNSAADRCMLARVGNPVAVNPSPALQRIARAAGWPVLTWDKNPPLSCREAQAECNSMSHYTAGVLANWAGESGRKA